ncbi:MAG: molecular chaperone HtpG [Alphaproteobacteria bacterium]|nr:molecular chaperone HtpG [Alphaproteobacteria bacterium]
MTNAEMKETNNPDYKMEFATDVSKLLDIVANALYSNRDIFLRELISNAADACDRLRYEAINNSKLTESSKPFHIRLQPTNDGNILNISDNGIGMNEEELIENLGTIARSGTAAILEQMKNAGAEKDINLIGQFGVGFYSSFMVSNQVNVISRKAGDNQTWHWSSDGKTGYDLREASTEEAQKLCCGHGTYIQLHLKPDATDYLLEDKLKQIVLAYSDHIEVPIYLTPKDAYIKTAEEKEAEERGEELSINAACALWTRPKNEISEEQYKEFYHHIGHVFDDPISTIHWRAEGKIEYTGLLFIPSLRPWDLYDPERKSSLRLYVKKVFITDDLDTLLYPWLRFVRGVIDSQDLPLNISREMLQNNPVVHKIRNGITKKVLSELAKLADKDEAAFLSTWHQFGAVIKEGLYDALEHRTEIFKICRFFTTNDPEKPTSLQDYVGRMKDGQEHIYYMSGENADSLRNSPQLEGFKSRGIEVLLMTDTVDEFWLQQVSDFEGKKFKSVTKGQIDLSQFDSKEAKQDSDAQEQEENEQEATDLSALLGFLATELKDQVAQVRPSKRLTESPVCLVADEKGTDMHMEKVLRIQQQYEPGVKRILEINPDHKLIKKLAGMAMKSTNNEILKDSAALLMDQALIIQGEPVPNSSEFAKCLSRFMEKGLIG